MAIASGLPVPKVYVIEDSAPNAFATGRDPDHAVVAVTTGLREKLDRDELQGVIAHELAHVRNFDIRYTTLVAVTVGAIALLADFALRRMWWAGPTRSRNRSPLPLILIAVVVAVLAPLSARLLQAAVSRRRETLADLGSAEMTRYPEALARALEKIEADPEVLEAANRATAPLYIVNPIKGFEKRAAALSPAHRRACPAAAGPGSLRRPCSRDATARSVFVRRRTAVFRAIVHYLESYRATARTPNPTLEERNDEDSKGGPAAAGDRRDARRLRATGDRDGRDGRHVRR
jgi:hypothetical protein